MGGGERGQGGAYWQNMHLMRQGLTNTLRAAWPNAPALVRAESKWEICRGNAELLLCNRAGGTEVHGNAMGLGCCPSQTISIACLLIACCISRLGHVLLILLCPRELSEAYEWLEKYKSSRKEAELHQVGAASGQSGHFSLGNKQDRTGGLKVLVN